MGLHKEQIRCISTESVEIEGQSSTQGGGRIRASMEASFSLIFMPNSFAYGS